MAAERRTQHSTFRIASWRAAGSKRAATAVAGIALSLGFGITACGGSDGATDLSDVAAELPDTTNARQVHLYGIEYGDEVLKPQMEKASSKREAAKIYLESLCASEKKYGVDDPRQTAFTQATGSAAYVVFRVKFDDAGLRGELIQLHDDKNVPYCDLLKRYSTEPSKQKPEAPPDGNSNDDLAQFAISGYEAAQNGGDMIKVDLQVACAVEQRHGVTSPLPLEETYAILGPDLNAIGSQTTKASIQAKTRLIHNGTDGYSDTLMSVYNNYNKAHNITACQAIDQINARS